MTYSGVAYRDGSNSFVKFISWTDEKSVLGQSIREKINPNYRRLLDVGCSDGTLTAQYIDSFQRATLVEPHLTQIQINTTSKMNIVESRIEDFTTSERFDLIVVSHVLLYIQNPLQVVEKLLSWLDDKGKLIIILTDKDSSYWHFLQTFKPAIQGKSSKASTSISIRDLEDFLALRRIQFDTKDVTSTITVPNIDEFISVSDFLFNTDRANIQPDVKKEMHAYLLTHTDTNGQLALNFKHRMFTINKEGL